MYNEMFHFSFTMCVGTHSTHQGVEDTDSKGSAAGERLSEVQLCVGVIIIILVQELNVWVIHWGKVNMGELKRGDANTEKPPDESRVEGLVYLKEKKNPLRKRKRKVLGMLLLSYS